MRIFNRQIKVRIFKIKYGIENCRRNCLGRFCLRSPSWVYWAYHGPTRPRKPKPTPTPSYDQWLRFFICKLQNSRSKRNGGTEKTGAIETHSRRSIGRNSFRSEVPLWPSCRQHLHLHSRSRKFKLFASMKSMSQNAHFEGSVEFTGVFLCV